MEIFCGPRSILSFDDYVCEIKNLTEIASNEHQLLSFLPSSTPIERIQSISIITNDRNEPNIDHIPVEVFSMLPNLRKLIVRSQIKDISAQDFTNAPKRAIELYLAFNRIAKLKAGIFEMVTLSYLDLSDNRIFDIDDFAFENQNALETIRLSSNKLTTIKRNTFAGLPKLWALSLSYNEIEIIENDAFRLPSIELLRLNGNKLHMLNINAFESTKAIEHIYFDADKIVCLNLKNLYFFGKIQNLRCNRICLVVSPLPC